MTHHPIGEICGGVEEEEEEEVSVEEFANYTTLQLHYAKLTLRRRDICLLWEIGGKKQRVGYQA